MRQRARKLKITKCEIDVIGDGPDIDPDKGGVEPLPILTVHTDAGITGISEMFRVPPGVARAALVGPEAFFGAVIGAELIHPEAIWNRLYDNMLHSNRRGWAVRCLGALDVALWDIFGKANALPVFELMGGAERNPFQTDPDKTHRATHITPYATIVSDTWEREVVLRQQVERCEQLAAMGYVAFKVEPMHSTHETAVELVKRTRKVLGPEAMLALDVGYGYVDHATTHFEFLDMMDRSGVTVCQPYASNVGGITESKRIVEAAKRRGALVIPGNRSTQILGLANAHVAAYSPVSPYVEYSVAEIYDSPLRAAIQELAPPVVNGVHALPSEPGIGIELTRDLIENFRLDL